MAFDGLHCGMNNIHVLSDAITRSISSENKDGTKGGGARAEVPVDTE